MSRVIQIALKDLIDPLLQNEEVTGSETPPIHVYGDSWCKVARRLAKTIGLTAILKEYAENRMVS